MPSERCLLNNALRPPPPARALPLPRLTYSGALACRIGTYILKIFYRPALAGEITSRGQKYGPAAGFKYFPMGKIGRLVHRQKGNLQL